jgi:hypothetical protein
LSGPGALLRLGRLTFNQRVVGSIPTALTNYNIDLTYIYFITSRRSNLIFISGDHMVTTAQADDGIKNYGAAF